MEEDVLYLTDDNLNTTVLIDNYLEKNLILLMMFVFQSDDTYLFYRSTLWNFNRL